MYFNEKLITCLQGVVLADLVPLRKRGTWQGYRNLVYAAGMGVGSLGGVVAEGVGWRR